MPITAVHPLVARMALLRKAEGLTRNEHTRRVGLAHGTMFDWEKSQAVPNIDNFDAALRALGYELKIAPRRAELAPLKYGPIIFTVLNLLRDNGARWWSLGEMDHALTRANHALGRRAISNALSRLVKEKRIMRKGESYRAIMEKARS